MLLAHPKVLGDPLRVRFAGFGAYSLDFEMFAYVRTRDWNDFLAIREEIFLRVADIVQEVGTSFAFPSQTHYLARDTGLDGSAAPTLEAALEAARAGGALAPPHREPGPRVRDPAPAAASNGAESGPQPDEAAGRRRAKGTPAGPRRRRQPRSPATSAR